MSLHLLLCLASRRDRSHTSFLSRLKVPSVFSLPQRKNDFLALVKNLCDVYLESSDEFVLQNIALSLSTISSGGHTRAADARLHLQRVASTLSGRLTELLAEKSEPKGNRKREPAVKRKKSSKRKRSNDDSVYSDASDDEAMDSESRDIEYAISSCLRRLRVLSKRCNLSDLLDDTASDVDSASGTVADVCDAVVSGMEERLKVRAVAVDTLSDNEGDDDDEPNVRVPEIWRSGDQCIHDVVAGSVNESLSLLLSITAWKLSMAQEEKRLLHDDEDITMEQEDEGDETDKYGVLSHRDQLIALLVLCFEQFLPPVADPSDAESMYSKEHLAFSDKVQTHACQIAGDLRSLFPKEWSEAVSPFLRACALTNDQPLAGGLVRYLRAKEEQVSHFCNITDRRCLFTGLSFFCDLFIFSSESPTKAKEMSVWPEICSFLWDEV